MGAPKGKPHRNFSKEEKLNLVKLYLTSRTSYRQFCEKHDLNDSVLKRWVKNYAEQGEEGLTSHRNRCGNRFSALHTSKSLDTAERLELRMLKLEADIARLKKGYIVKGSGLNKEFVTSNGKNFKL